MSRQDRRIAKAVSKAERRMAAGKKTGGCVKMLYRNALRGPAPSCACKKCTDERSYSQMDREDRDDWYEPTACELLVEALDAFDGICDEGSILDGEY